MLSWFDSRQAAQFGIELADEFALREAPAQGASRGNAPNRLDQLLRHADNKVRPLRLNFYQKAKFANSFKWRLIENGITQQVADDVTQSVIVHLAQSSPPVVAQDLPVAAASRSDRAKAQDLFNRGNKCFANAAYADAMAFYEQALELDSSHAEAMNNLGSSLSLLNRLQEAEHCYRQAISLKPNYADPYGNLGTLLRTRSNLVGAEFFLRSALKLRPNFVEARINLGLTLAFLGRLRDARACFSKELKTAPRNTHALYGMGQLALLEGRFDAAETTFRQIIEIDPKMPGPWAALAGLRKMTAADASWYREAKTIAASGIHAIDEANLRFALGKYCDDTRDFDQAFENYRRANDLVKSSAGDYKREERVRLVDDLIRVYSKDAISKIKKGGSDSEKPIFVVGMPRSGTSLTEQIIASHPAAYGAGELTFWETLLIDEKSLTKALPDEPTRARIAHSFLRILDSLSANALRVIDKAPVNSDLLGLIYCVFPNARVIYMQRDPIDTCLSCYFQQFLTGLNFTFDLSDLVHYSRQHQRLMAHWRAVLPQGVILDVPYEKLVDGQEAWSRKILEFIGLEWDDRCLEFYDNKRQVVSASAWQVRQKIYTDSVARWRNYEKFLGPLKALRQ